MKNIGKAIESRLQILDMTQEELGKEIGLNQRTISRYVRGYTIPSIETLEKICDVLDIRVGELIDSSSSYQHSGFMITDPVEMELIKNFKKLNKDNQVIVTSLIKTIIRDTKRHD